MNDETEIRLSRTQEKRFKCLAVERVAIRNILEMAMESMTCRETEIIRLDRELWDEVVEQHNLDSSKKWTWTPGTRTVRVKHSKGPKRGFTFDDMDDEGKE